MNYSETKSYIEQKNSLGIHPGLDAVLAVLSELGHPERAVPAVHIAGTNGKGSIMTFVESALIREGLKVGRYISPAISGYRERWNVNRSMPEKERVAELFTEIREAEKRAGTELTAFEAETAAAFLLFREEKCDIMLIECGMGGRLDATNVMPQKVVDILASVSLDHMQFLGNTREEILHEKLGIVQPGDVLVTAPLDESLRAELEKTELQWVETKMPDKAEYGKDGTDFIFDDMRISLGMAGSTALENAVTALTALKVYNSRAEQFGLRPVEERLIPEAFHDTKWPGRFECIRRNPTVIVDGAHNRDAWYRLAENMKKLYPGRLILVTGVLADKEVECLTDTFAPLTKKVLTFTPDSPRALSGEKLAELFGTRGVPAVYCGYASEAMAEALREATPDDVILAAGSLTFTGELLNKKEEIAMFRIRRILEDEFYKKQIKKIISSEYERDFCRHGFGHVSSVARIAYILSLEEGGGIPKEMIYATALLHDIGRYTELEKKMSHHEAGAKVADEVLRRAGFTENERQEITEAISGHKDPGERSDTLSGILFRADKLSRNCFVCDVREECYWPEERKNKTIWV